jgi:hypothetical protein
MMINHKFVCLLVTSTVVAGFNYGAAFAADVDVATGLPAVSGINGKIQASAGWQAIDGFSDDFLFRGGASLSIPVGDRFGLQADFAAVDGFTDTAVSGTLHAFTRDPNAYLFGAIGGFGTVGSTDVWYVGPEAELYIDNISIEATGGWMNVDVAGVTSDKMFGVADLGLYATDNLRLNLGVSSIADFESGHAGLEWNLADMGAPVSFTLDGRIGESNYRAISAGFTFYFGGDSNKSLIRRHREDDPRNRSLDIFAGAGNAFVPPAPTVPVDPCLGPNPPETCIL